MNFRALTRKYLGWCPGFKDNPQLIRGYELFIPTNIAARFIFFVLLTSLGIQYILSLYRYWFIRVPHSAFPLDLSPWRKVSDLLICVSSLGLILLGIDTLSSITIRNRHRKMLGIVLMLWGASRIIRVGSLDIYMVINTGFRSFDIFDLVPYAWSGGLLFVGYRLFTNKPLIVKSTLIAVSVMSGSQLIRLLFQTNQAIPNAGFHPLYSTLYLVHVLATFSAFILSMNGIRGKWSDETLFKRGVPWYLKSGLIIYGISDLYLIVWAKIFEPGILTEITSNYVSPFITSFAVLNGLALVTVALYPWKSLSGGT